MNLANDDQGQAPHSTSAIVRRLLKLTWRYRWWCCAVLALQIAILLLNLSGLRLVGLGVDYIEHEWRLLGGEGGLDLLRWPFGWAPPSSWRPLKVVSALALAILAFNFLRFLLTMGNTILTNYVVQSKLVVDLRAAVYDKMQRLSFRFFDSKTSGSLINRVTSDVQTTRMFVQEVLIKTIILGITLVIFLVFMLSINVSLTLACLLPTPLIWYFSRLYGKIVKPQYRRNRLLTDDLVGRMVESIQGIHVVKGFAMQEEEIRQFNRHNRKVRDQKQRIFHYHSLLMPAIQGTNHLSLLILIGYGGYLFMQGQITLGTGLLVFYNLLLQFSMQVDQLANLSNVVQQALVGAQRVFEVLDAPIEVQSPPRPLRVERIEGRVEFERVSFNYRGTGDDARWLNALEDIDFRVEPGQCVAFLGATGSGKSTLLSLIPRFYDPTIGRILLDDRDLREYDLDFLRRNVGVVFQESFLFSTTIAANIAFGHPEASPAQIEKAARVAAAHEFITQMPQGYNSILSEGGDNLSGGQRQRLAIARAILLEPPVLLLDDPTAAIDPETEEEIMQAMENAMRGRTTFIVAHRLSTLRRADRIIVLDQGRIVEQGTHESLMSNNGLYLEAASNQLADSATRKILASIPEQR